MHVVRASLLVRSGSSLKVNTRLRQPAYLPVRNLSTVGRNAQSSTKAAAQESSNMLTTEQKQQFDRDGTLLGHA